MHDVFRSKPFRNYVLAVLIYNLPFILACPYYQVFNLTIMNMKTSLIAYMSIAYAFVRVVTTPYCGRLLDRRGPRYILLVSGPFYALFFFAFMFGGPARVWPVFLGWMAMGVT